MLLSLLFFVSVKGVKGPIGPIGDLGTKGVEVMFPCYVAKMCLSFFYVNWGTNLRPKSVLTDYFLTQGDPGGRGAPGDLGTRGEMVSCCYWQTRKTYLLFFPLILTCFSLTYFCQYGFLFVVWHKRGREVVLETRGLPDRKGSGWVCLLLKLWLTCIKKLYIYWELSVDNQLSNKGTLSTTVEFTFHCV